MLLFWLRRWARRLPVAGPLTRSMVAVTVGLAAGIAPRAASAQESGNGFLFREPAGSIALRGGYSLATAGGDLISFVTDQLTLNKRDFSGPQIGADLALRMAPRLDLVLGTSYAGTSTASEFRHLVDQNNAPINQTTTFTRIPVTASVRAYLTPRGRSIGHYAWVPARIAPYAGVGGGALWYRFRQEGDFVDFATNNVFSGSFTSSRWTPAAVGMLGADYSLSSHVALTGEAKYLLARATPTQSFDNGGFNSIDLSGLSLTAGLYFRF